MSEERRDYANNFGGEMDNMIHDFNLFEEEEM